MTNIWNWSRTAANNSTADGSLWPENQLPSTVNNSARDNMASVARWRDDVSGMLVTAGSSNAFTLTSATTSLSLSDGLTVAFRADRANTGAATLNVDGTGNKNLKKLGGTDLSSGDIVSGAIYRATYYQSGDEWRLQSAVAPAATGDVTAAATFDTDNVIIRSDGTSKGVQKSGVAIDDSNNVSGIGALSATTVELGHATDTTIARVSAGVVSVEGETVHTNSVSRTVTAAGIELGHATDTTITRLSAGTLAVEGVQALLAGQTATISKGFTLTPNNLGSVTSGTTTLDPTLGNYQVCINGGAHTIAPPAAGTYCAIDLEIINGPSAGSITLSGAKWQVGSSTGATYSTTARSNATATITIASPGVVSWTGHGCADGSPVYFTTSGALPTGLSASTVYYVKYVDANSFQLATTPGGTSIVTSGSQSGTHTCYACSVYILSVRQVYGAATYSWYAKQ